MISGGYEFIPVLWITSPRIVLLLIFLSFVLLLTRGVDKLGHRYGSDSCEHCIDAMFPIPGNLSFARSSLPGALVAAGQLHHQTVQI